MVTTMERRLGEMLVKENIISNDNLEKALKKQETENGSLGRVIVEMGLASEWEMAAAIGKQLKVPFITPVSYTHLRAHETVLDLVCRLLLEKKNKTNIKHTYD